MKLPLLLARTAWQSTRFTLRTSARVGTRVGKRVSAPVGRAVADKMVPLPRVEEIPPGRMLKLRGRGRTYVIDVPGPTPDAPTVLLLHGLATNAQLCWFGAMAELSSTHRVVAFDQRWHGRGIHSPRFLIEDCADDAAAVLKTLGIDSAIVVGYSMGGPVAQELWRRHPDRVRGLVLASTSCNWRGHLGEKVFFPLMTVAMDRLSLGLQSRVAQFALRLPEHPEPFAGDVVGWGAREFRSTSLLSVPEVLGELGRFNSTSWIGGIDVPTVVVVTAKDKSVPAARQRAMAAMIPGATVHEAPGGHASVVMDYSNWMPVFLEAVEDVTVRVRRAGLVAV